MKSPVASAPTTEEISEMVILLGNTLKAPLDESLSSKNEELLMRITYCESKNDPQAKNPNSTAYGLCQFIDGTWDYVQNKWDMILDRKNPVDQMYACKRLLNEEGTIHWLESQSCWEK